MIIHPHISQQKSLEALKQSLKNATGIFLAVGRSLTKPPPQLPPKLAVDFEAMGDRGKVNGMGCPVSWRNGHINGGFDVIHLH